jgi:hypothetical protein
MTKEIPHSLIIRFQDDTRALAALLGLGSWEFLFHTQLAEVEDFFARVNYVAGVSTAYIELGRPFLACSTDRRLTTIIHECLHLHFCPMKFSIKEVLKQNTSPQVAKLARAEYRRQEEYIVDNLARSIEEILVQAKLNEPVVQNLLIDFDNLIAWSNGEYQEPSKGPKKTRKPSKDSAKLRLAGF